MKTLVLLTVFTLNATLAHTQWSSNYLKNRTNDHYLFGSGDIIAGNYKGGDIGINYIYNNKFSIKLGFSISEKLVTTLPQDLLKSGQTLSSIGLKAPNENFENIHLLFGRVFSLDKKNKLRLTMQGGPGISAIREPEFSNNENNINPSHSDYSISYQRTSHLSVIVNPKIEFPFASVLGLSVGPMVIVNEERTFWGTSIGLMYGIVGCNSL